MHNMEMVPVIGSSNIAKIGHKDEMMHVQFHDGRKYAYAGVNAEGVTKLRAAKSVGKHLNAMNVRGVALPTEHKRG